MKKIILYFGTHVSSDMATEMRTRKKLVLPEPTVPQDQIDAYTKEKDRLNDGYLRMRAAHEKKQTALEAKLTADPDDYDVGIELAQLLNDMEAAKAKNDAAQEVQLTGDAQFKWQSEWKTYRERNAKLELHRGRAFNIIKSQCTLVLRDRLEEEDDWATVVASQDPLELLDLIEIVVLTQNKAEYPFATVHEQQRSVTTFQQDQHSLSRYYELFLIKLNVAKSVGVTFQHPGCLEWSSQHLYQKTWVDIEAAVLNAANAAAKQTAQEAMDNVATDAEN